MGMEAYLRLNPARSGNMEAYFGRSWNIRAYLWSSPIISWNMEAYFGPIPLRSWTLKVYLRSIIVRLLGMEAYLGINLARSRSNANVWLNFIKVKELGGLYWVKSSQINEHGGLCMG